MIRLILTFTLLTVALFSKTETDKIDTLQFRIGLYAGGGYDLHSSNFSAIKGLPNCCTNFNGGSGDGILAGLYLEIPYDRKLSFALDTRYRIHNADLTVENVNIGNTLILDANGNTRTTEVNVNHLFTPNFSSISFIPKVHYNVYRSTKKENYDESPFKFDLTGGLTISYLMGGVINQSEVITKPDNITFLDGKLARNEFTAAPVSLGPIVVAPLIGVRSQLQISKNLDIEPFLNFQLGLMNITGVSWKYNSLEFGLAIVYNSFKSRKPIEIFKEEYKRDTVIAYDPSIKESEIILLDTKKEKNTAELGTEIVTTTTIYEKYELKLPKKLNMNFDFTILGITADGKKQQVPTLIIEETETIESFPILPQVFFAENSSQLALTSSNILNEAQATNYDIKNLKWNTLEIFKEALNLIAYRLKNNSNAKITLVGNNANIGSEENNLTLSEERANAVKKYLVDVWKINQNRIAVKKQNLPSNPGKSDDPMGMAENRRVEVYSDDLDVMKPMELREIFRTSNPPQIEIEPSGKAEAEEYNWKMEVSQNGKQIRSFDGNNDLRKLTWNVTDEPVPQLETPLDFTFDAIDKYGNKFDLTKQMQIKQLTIKKKREELHDDKLIEKYALIVFDFDKATVNQLQRNILDEIKKKIKPNSIVTIEGYSDILGDAEYNLNLSSKRCTEVQKYLNLPNAQIKPYGNSVLLYDNSTPQGRAYSRTVKIIIETPLK
jgi:outer membrane protein OmpA-like peptidoglycan-associated protein